MNLFEKFRRGLPYSDFLKRYASEGQKIRWHQMHELVLLTPAQRQFARSGSPLSELIRTAAFQLERASKAWPKSIAWIGCGS